MLLTITTTHQPATDLSYLLHKHPARTQQVDLSAGVAHVFYTELTEARTTGAILLDIDPIGLVRKAGGPGGNDFALEQYVNDRPYVASSFMSAALVKAFSTAMNGRCKDKPELVSVPMPFEVSIAVLPVRGGEAILRGLFEPLGYRLSLQQHPVDPSFPEWGESRYFTLRLYNTVTLQQLLSHLYVLIPVCDNDKHYWVGQHEVEKLMEKGAQWLPLHPMRELITLRYLRHQRSLAKGALDILLKEEVPQAAGEEDDAAEPPAKMRVHDLRLQAVRDAILASGAKKVADLGCGEGKLLRLLLAEKSVETILGMDVSSRSLAIAHDRLELDRLPERQRARITLIQGSLTYRDRRMEGFDAAALVEVIEHLDEPRLAALQRVVFEFAKPRVVIITTPNAEYNVKFPDYEEGAMRHGDHRFEWTRQQFQSWCNAIAEQYGYSVSYTAIGEEDAEVGALTQMAQFEKQKG